MKKNAEEGSGFRCYLTDEQLQRYRRKPLALRLAWLYQGNVLRMHLPPEIKQRQDRFRNGTSAKTRGSPEITG